MDGRGIPAGWGSLGTPCTAHGSSPPRGSPWSRRCSACCRLHAVGMPGAEGTPCVVLMSELLCGLSAVVLGPFAALWDGAAVQLLHRDRWPHPGGATLLTAVCCSNLCRWYCWLFPVLVSPPTLTQSSVLHFPSARLLGTGGLLVCRAAMSTHFPSSLCFVMSQPWRTLKDIPAASQ